MNSGVVSSDFRNFDENSSEIFDENWIDENFDEFLKPEISEIQLDNIIGGEEIDETAVLLDVDDDDVDFDEVEDDDGAGEVDIKQEPSENFVDEAYEEIQMEEEQFQESPEDANLTDKVCFWESLSV